MSRLWRPGDGRTGANWGALGLYTAAVPAAYLNPAVSLGLILCNALLYVVPEAFSLKL